MNGPRHAGRHRTIRYFGDYVLLGEIAGGGMGVVFNARQVSLNRKVAVKLIRGGQLAGETELQRFRTEARAAARLDHPHIVPIYEIGEHQGQPFIVMKLIEGDSLAEFLTDGTSPPQTPRPPLPLPQTAALVAKVAHAIQHAHEQGVLHRDIKPGNILLDAAGEPHLTDFGLAKLLEADSSQTVTNAILGTPEYMAPEQAGGNIRAITAACDIYSLGAVLYALLTGRPPLLGHSSTETIQFVKNQKPLRPQAINPDVDDVLESICLKCLEKDPGQRYPTARALADDLESWQRCEPILARSSRPQNRLRQWAGRHAIWAVLAAVLAGGVLCLLGLLGLVALGHRPRGTAGHDDASSATPGALQLREVKWQKVLEATVQAQPNCGYRIETPAQATITLPVTPNPGDVLRISGAAPGGWRLLQNSNQVILTDNIDAGMPGSIWEPRAQPRQWHDMAVSADGTKLIVADFGYREGGGAIYTSADGGTSWTQQPLKRLWTSVSMAADGSRLFAAAVFSRIYLSTNFGATWTPHGSGRNWTDLASSDDGLRVVAIDAGTNTTGGQIYTSNDGGINWTPHERDRVWSAIASSADGSKLIAAAGNTDIKGHAVFGYIYLSPDYGETWTPSLIDAPRRWLGVASSADGRRLVAVEDNARAAPGGHIYVSADAGRSWQVRGPISYWVNVALSSDGTRMMAISHADQDGAPELYYISNDFGTTWTPHSSMAVLSQAAWSANARKLVAISGSFTTDRDKNNIYTSTASTIPGHAGAFTAEQGAQLDLQHVREGRFRILRANGRFAIDGAAPRTIQFPGRN